MKKIILFIAFGFSILTIQSCGSDKKDKDKDNKEEKTVNVPDAVRSAFSAKYSTASDIKWEDAHENDKQTYKAKFMLDGKKRKAEFDATGNFIKEKEDD